MSMTQRVLIAFAIVAVDLAVFFLPLSAVFLAYILIVNPPWFRKFLKNLGPEEPRTGTDQPG